MINNNDSVITLDDVSKDYGHSRGIFSVSFQVKKGESFGLVGENGAGKTTTIRNIMGFIRPDSGTITVKGLDAFKEAPKIKEGIGYVPGEISLPPLKTGKEVLESQMDLLGCKDFSIADSLISRLQLNIKAYPKRMSKGMKQKMALVMALMANPDTLILDEPTTGLDPLMQNEFMDVLLDSKKSGKTILMSSNSYDELASLCDSVALISQGRIVAIADCNAIRNKDFENYKLEFENNSDYLRFKGLDIFPVRRDQPKYNQVTVTVKKKDLSQLFQVLSRYQMKFITEVPYSLETYFDDIRHQGDINNGK